MRSEEQALAVHVTIAGLTIIALAYWLAAASPAVPLPPPQKNVSGCVAVGDAADSHRLGATCEGDGLRRCACSGGPR